METTTAYVDASAESKADQATIAQFIATRDKLIELRNEFAVEEEEIANNDKRYSETARLHAAGDESADRASILADSDRRKHRAAGLRLLITEQEQLLKQLEGPNRLANAREQAKHAAHRIVDLNNELTTAQSRTDEAQLQLDRAQAEMRRIRQDIEEAQSRQSHITRDLHSALSGAA